MPKKTPASTPAPEATMEATSPTTDVDAAAATLSEPAPEPVNTAPITFAEPPAPAVMTVDQAVAALQERGVAPKPPAAAEFIDNQTYQEAEDDNHRENFMRAIAEARKPPPLLTRPAMIIPPQLAEQTRLEMEAGAKRVAEHAAMREKQAAIHAAHKNDKWEEQKNQVVFRDPTYVPDPKKGAGHVGGQSRDL